MLIALRAMVAALTIWAPTVVLARGDHSIVPGLLGYNALPAIPNADPVIEDQILLEFSATAQLGDLTSTDDGALAPYVRLAVPFHRLVALEIDVLPVEWWRVSPPTRQKLGALSSHGVDLGDLRFGARFFLWSESDQRPAIGIRFVTKTTTGKGFENRRFIDAPAYAVDTLFGKTLVWRQESSLGLRFLAKIGFMAWQQGSDWQDDAIDVGTTLQLRSGPTRLEIEWRGYWGYEKDDRPHLLGLTVGHRKGNIEWTATLNRGLTDDAPPWELRAGVIFRFDSPWSNSSADP